MSTMSIHSRKVVFSAFNFGHVSQVRYVELLEEARWRYLEENNQLEPILRLGAFHVVTNLAIQYRQGARIGELKLR